MPLTYVPWRAGAQAAPPIAAGLFLSIPHVEVQMDFRKPWSLCGARKPGKLASAYWAWFLADETRTAWKQRLDAECLTEAYGSLLQKSRSDSMDADTCIACGGSLEGDLDPVFLTLYLPRLEPREYELGTCAACAASLRSIMQTGAEKLEDRSARGPSPSAPASNPFADLPF